MGKTTELLSLVKSGNSDAARKLIAKLKKSGKKKALAKELNIPDDNGQTVVHYCATQNFVEFLQDLTEMGASFEIADDKGYTPLHLASGAGRTGAVTVLLGHGADPNIASRSGDTPLHLACQNGHAQAVEALISENSNCTMLNVSGQTPLDLACLNGHPQVVSLLLRSGQFSQSYLQRSDMPHNALLLAAKHSHNEVIGLLVKHGFDVNRKLPGANGSCLHEAVLYGRVDTVKYLLQCGADVSMVNSQGLTALDIVNMYTDPRSAGQMKQVLQDALAHQARVRMAQQQHYQQRGPQQHYQQHPPQAQQHHQPHHQYPSQASQQRAQYSSQPQPHHQPHHQYPSQPSQLGAQHSQAHQHRAFPQHPSSQQQQQQRPQQQRGPPQHSQPQYPQQHSPTGQSSPLRSKPQGFSYLLPTQRQHSVPVTHLEQRTYSTGQQSPDRSDRLQHHQPQAHARQPMQQEHHMHHQDHMPAYRPEPPPDEQPSAFAQQLLQQKQQLHLQQQQQPHPQTGEYHTPETTKRGVGLGTPFGLAAEIAAKAANRKPMVSSPTKKDFDDPRFGRSATISSVDTSMNEARHAALQHRRGSLSDRSSRSPEQEAGYDRSNPPTLPRRTHGGPPAFKPIPPPAEGDQKALAPHADHHQPHSRGEKSPSPEVEKPRLRKIQHSKPPPPAQTSSVDDELMKKLRRRQDRIEQAEQAPVEEEVPAEEEPHQPPEPEVPPAPSKPSIPPPKPERSIPPVTTTVAEQPPLPEKTEKAEPPPPQPKPKPKPPPPAPKSSGLTPWQEELMKRKMKKAASESEVQVSGQPSPGQPLDQPSPPVLPEPPEPSPPKHIEMPPPKPVQPSPPKSTELSPPQPSPQQPSPQQPSPPKSTEPLPHFEPSPPKPVEPSPPPPDEAVIPPPFAFAQPPVALPPSSQPPPPHEEAPLPMTQVADLRLPAAAFGGDEGKKAADEVKAAAPSTPSSDQMSRSTSLSSLPGAGTISPLQPSEPLPIGDWLALYKLPEYLSLFEASGYDSTDFVVGITQEELMELGVQKVGHRKKILAALTSVVAKDRFLNTKPDNISEWLSLLSLAQYETVLLDAGYDDIDFVSEITMEELRDIGITKRGHLKRFMRGIGELAEFPKRTTPIPGPPPLANGPTAHPTPPSIHLPLAPSEKQPEAANSLTASQQLLIADSKLKRASQEETTLLQNGGAHEGRPRADSDQAFRPRQDSTGQNTYNAGSSFSKMRSLLEQQMGISRSTESLEHSDNDSTEAPKASSRSPSASPQVHRKQMKVGVPPPVPRRAAATSLSAGRQDSLVLSRHSLSSSTSSLSSNFSERTTGSYDVSRASGEAQPSMFSAPASGTQSEVQQSPPRIPPKHSRKSAQAMGVQGGGQDSTDLVTMHTTSFSVEDITAVLDTTLRENEETLQFMSEEVEGEGARREEGEKREGERREGDSQEGERQHEGPEGADELDELTRALQGFEPETGQSNKPSAEPQADQLLADIDDMLTNLSMHLDFMIPGSS